jgi:hypothetical protein
VLKLGNCLLFEALQQGQKLVIHFEPNTMQTTMFTEPYPRQSEAQEAMKIWDKFYFRMILLAQDTSM